MAINPNIDFTVGQVATSDQMNRFPRGVMALASSTTNYTLTTSVVISTGMTVTFTAVANRNYKITYREPQAQVSSAATAQTKLELRVTNASGTLLNTAAFQQQGSVNNYNGTMSIEHIATFSAGSVTLVGCSTATNTTGTPSLLRSATQPAQITVEDLGPA